MILGKNFFFFCLCSLIFLLPGCWPGKNKESVSKIEDFAIVNVLGKDYYDDCHIKAPNSIYVDYQKIDEIGNMIGKNAEVVLYCANYMCKASANARNKMLQMGYDPKKVFLYEGGAAEWFKKGFPVGGPCKKGYLAMVGEPPEEKTDYMLTAEELKAKVDAYIAQQKK